MPLEKNFKKDSYIFVEGDEESGSVFLVKRGRVKHVCSSPGLSQALQDASEGDFFGFISAFSGRPRLSSAIAAEETAVVEIGGEQLLEMLREKREIAMKIMSSYSHALQKYDSVLMGIKPISLLYPHSMSLQKLGEYYMDKGENLIASYIFSRYVQLYPDSENVRDIEKFIDDIAEKPAGAFYSDNERGDLIYDDRAVIFCEHEPGDLLYFIEEGRVKIMKQSRNSDMLLAVLGRGEIFGELALITSQPRSATAVSFGGARLVPVDTARFRGMIGESPDLIKKIITSISQRLWFNHVRLSQMSYRKPITRLFAFLETKLMEDGVSLKRKAQHQFQFGLDELIEMNELNLQQHSDEINELVGNRFLSFNFGTITVLNPCEFTSDVQMYKQRDRIPSSKKTPRGPGREETGTDGLPEQAEETTINPEIADILPGLNDADPSKRVNAVIRLGNLGERARESVPFLRERLGDDVKIIRRNAARSITSILPPGESFRVFSEAMRDDNPDTRSAAATGLGELNIADRSGIIDLLVKSLSDWSPAVRGSAARSLGYLGLEADKSAPRIMRLLSDSDSSVRILAVSALAKVTAKGEYLDGVIDAVKSAGKNDKDKFVNAAAREALITLNRRKRQH